MFLCTIVVASWVRLLTVIADHVEWMETEDAQHRAKKLIKMLPTHALISVAMDRGLGDLPGRFGLELAAELEHALTGFEIVET